MDFLVQTISKPWPWYVSGPLIALVMILLFSFGKTFGVSYNLRTMCSIAGAKNRFEYFTFDWKAQVWNLLFVAGAIIGGAIASIYLDNGEPIDISASTFNDLKLLGVNNFSSYIPIDIFNWNNLFTLKGFIIFVGGGFLIGFGTRYAGGCTSGHAITGLSNLQLPSLIAVIGFFIGGLIMTHLLLPLILSL